VHQSGQVRTGCGTFPLYELPLPYVGATVADLNDGRMRPAGPARRPIPQPRSDRARPPPRL